MSNSTKAMIEFSDNDWDTLLRYIKQGRVVPVLGPDLLLSHSDNGHIPFYQAIRNRLDNQSGKNSNTTESLNDFFLRFVEDNESQKAQANFSHELKELENEEQPTLEKLSSIKAFRLFLTTTPDSLLSKSLTANGLKNESYFFTTTKTQKLKIDLPSRKLQESKYYIYHLYGMASNGYDYAITEDDRLRFSCEWLICSSKIKNLLKYLEDKYLLILGCEYENWLARFFLYGLKETKLFYKQDIHSLLVDTSIHRDIMFEKFLSRCKGYIYRKDNISEFVDELYNRCSSITMNEVDNNPFTYKSIFISYAHEDREIAKKIKQRLENFSLKVWLDIDRLKSGDAFNRKIPFNIKNSAIFLAILSKTTANNDMHRPYRKEWELAIDEAPNRPEKVPFIHPFAIDDVNIKDENLQKITQTRTCKRAQGGEIEDNDIIHLCNLIKQLER